MESIFDILAKIEKDPVRFLGNPSCEKLWGFLMGWETATPAFLHPKDDSSFRSWFHETHGFREGVLNEFTIALLAAGNDHDAFFLYFEGLGTYRKVNPLYFESLCVYGQPDRPVWGRREMMERTIAKPGMYIGAKSVTRFRGCLDGDAYARRQADPEVKLYADLERLDQWLAKKENLEKAIRCEALAMVYGGHNEAGAFDWLISKITEFESLAQSPQENSAAE